jgi:hypothetical protein
MLVCQIRWICGMSSSSCWSRAQRNCGLRNRLRDAGNTTGQSARPFRSVRPRICHGAGRYTPSTLGSAVALRLGEKRAGRLEDVIGPTQLLDLALQCLELIAFAGDQPLAFTLVNLVMLYPFIEGLRNAANLGGYRFNGCPSRWVLSTVLLHHAYSTFAPFGGKTI